MYNSITRAVLEVFFNLGDERKYRTSLQQYWTHVDTVGQNWTHLDKTGQNWIGHNWTKLDI